MQRRFFVLVALIFWFIPTIARAADFNPHFILSDNDLTGYDTMSQAEIQSFLDVQPGALKTMRFADQDGQAKPVAQIIFEAAKEERISPRYLLVVLQKEQGLISDATPSAKQLDWATGYGVCDACSLEDPSIQKFRGFATQVRDAAGLMRWYYDNLATQTWIKRAGLAYTIDNTTVIPQSNATAFLYNYTPHLSGNKNFWKLWSAWWQRFYPDGSLLQPANDKTVYLVQGGLKRALASWSALTSRFDPNLIIKVQPQDLAGYADGPKIILPNYTLARTPNGTTYLLVDDLKHPLASAAVFKQLGYNPAEVEDVSEEDLAGYQSGTFITTASVYPLGAVVQEKKTQNYYYVRNGERQIIPHPDIIKVNFPKKKTIVLDNKTLVKYPLQNKPLLFKEGTLLGVKGSPFIYVISNGTRRYIPNESTFKFLGFQTKNIFPTSEQALSAVPEGAPLPDTATPAQNQIASR